VSTTTVYGYISLEHDDEHEVDRLHDLMAAFARAQDMEIIETYVDRNTPTGRVVRPGLAVLLDAILHGEDSLVLIPTPGHLSTVPPVRRAIEIEIESLGGRVVPASNPEGAEPPAAAVSLDRGYP
jgi:hypothetical protein